MPSRRALLRAGGAAALAALAGCQSVAAPFSETTDPTSAGAGQLRLDAEPVAPADVEDGATVGVASPDLYELVEDAAGSDGRVDLERYGTGVPDVPLALGEFAALKFAGETYEPTASVVGFAEEASYQYEALDADESEVDEDDEVVAYGDLTADQRAIADEILDGGTYFVGYHEEKPAAVEPFDGGDYLRANSEMYRIREVVGDRAAHHMLELDSANPGDDAQVVTVLDERPAADWSAVLQEGVGPGSVGIDDVPEDDALVEYLRRVDYVATATSVLDVSVTQTVQ